MLAIVLIRSVPCSRYHRFFLIADFNVENSKETLFNLLEKHNAANNVKYKTCFKSLGKPSCTDLFITNRTRCFQSITGFRTGLSDFHKMAVVTVLETSFSKKLPNEMF